MNYTDWNSLSFDTAPIFDSERKVFVINVEKSTIQTPPLLVTRVDSDNVICQFNPSFSHFYSEINGLYEKLAMLLYENRETIFQLDVPHERIQRLLVRPILLPDKLNQVPSIKIAMDGDKCDIGAHYIFNLEFDHLTLSPTDIVLNLHTTRENVRKSQTVFVNNVEDSITDSDYDK